VETPHNIMKNVVAVGISEDGSGSAGDSAGESAGQDADKKVLASVTVIMNGNERAALVNGAFREYSHLLIGRMGLPHRSSDKYIINVMLEGSAGEIGALSHRLSLIPDISVKTTYE